MVSDTLRLPLRAVVASSSATRSSRSAQQSPPRSAALAGDTPATATKPSAAYNATLLADFNIPPTIAYYSVGLTLPEFRSNRPNYLFLTHAVLSRGSEILVRLPM